MNQSINLSEGLYRKLQSTARNNGFESLEEFIQKLIEVWQAQAEELRRRRAVVFRIDEMRARLSSAYGEMQDSVEMIRADRER